MQGQAMFCVWKKFFLDNNISNQNHMTVKCDVHEFSTPVAFEKKFLQSKLALERLLTSLVIADIDESALLGRLCLSFCNLGWSYEIMVFLPYHEIHPLHSFLHNHYQYHYLYKQNKLTI